MSLTNEAPSPREALIADAMQFLDDLDVFLEQAAKTGSIGVGVRALYHEMQEDLKANQPQTIVNDHHLVWKKDTFDHSLKGGYNLEVDNFGLAGSQPSFTLSAFFQENGGVGVHSSVLPVRTKELLELEVRLELNHLPVEDDDAWNLWVGKAHESSRTGMRNFNAQYSELAKTSKICLTLGTKDRKKLDVWFSVVDEHNPNNIRFSDYQPVELSS